MYRLVFEVKGLKLISNPLDYPSVWNQFQVSRLEKKDANGAWHAFSADHLPNRESYQQQFQSLITKIAEKKLKLLEEKS